MSTEKTASSSASNLANPRTSIPSSTLQSEAPQHHSALRHFYGADDDKRDQRLVGQGYTAKTLRYLLPMLTNKGRCIRYVYGTGKESLSLKETIHGLCLSSKALGRPGVLVLADPEPSQGVRVLFIFAQQGVVVEAAPNLKLTTDQEATFQALKQEQVLHNIQQAPPLWSGTIDPKDSGPILMEWLSRVLKKTLSEILSGVLNVSDPQFFQLSQSMDASVIKKFRRRYENLLMDIPEEAVSSGLARSEEEFVKQCYAALPQRLLPRLKNSLILKNESFVVKSKQLRNLLWDERKDAMVEEFKALSRELNETSVASLLSASDIQRGKFLAEGNFGAVYEGLWSGTKVAVKVLKPQSNPMIQEEFKSEVAFMLQLKHPRIVSCYGLCGDPMQAVFEYMSGGSLESVLREQGVPKTSGLSWPVKQQMLLDMSEAVHYLHARQMIHGDLRASNFLLNEQQEVKLGDFGLARQRDTVLTVAGANIRDMSRLSWLAPELLSMEGVSSFESDTYSFGMVIWELVTGYAPFCSKDRVCQEDEIGTLIKKGEVLKHHPLPEETPPWVVAIFERCLSFKADERPKMAEIVQVLCLAANPDKYAQLYPKKHQTTVMSSWLKDTLALIPQEINQTLSQSGDKGKTDTTDSDDEIGDLGEASEAEIVADPKSSSVAQSISDVSTPKDSSLNLRVGGTARPVSEGVLDPSLIQVDETKKLGQGGFGVVYRGKYRGQDVAVKQLLVQEFSPKTQEEFEHESQTMLQLRDPSVVHLYGVTKIKPYRMVLEYCELGSLDRYLQKKAVSEVSWKLRFHLSTGIASGLHYLHTYQPIIIHGDLKSLNVLLVGNPDVPKVKLGDFGMARLKTETQSKTARSVNKGSEGLTVSWAAPELFSLKGKKSLASDMYAFGMTLWEIASHSYPYANCSDPFIIQSAVMRGEREEVPEETPELFAEVMTACWSQDPKDRPSAGTALNKLQSYESSVQAQPEEENEGRPIDAGSLSGGCVSSAKSKSSSSSASASPVTSIGAKTPEQSKKSSESSSTAMSTQKEDKTKSAFFQAAKNGDQTKLSNYQELLDEGLGERDADGNTALHHAAANGHVELVKWLVKEQDRYASESNDQGDTPLLLAARNGKQAVVEWLIELEDVDSSKRNNQDSSALLLSSERGHLSLVAWLLENRHSQLKEQDKQRKTVFSSPHSSIVLWVTLYREVSKSPDVASSPGLEAIVAYQGADTKLLHLTTLRLLVRLNAQKLLESYREKIKIWWSTFSEAEQSTLPTLKAILYPVKPVKAESPQLPGQPKTSVGTQRSLSYPEQDAKGGCGTQDKIHPEKLKALFKWVTEGHLLEVEKLLKKNPTLALGALTVTDLSDRTFKNITVLQYAAWALDSEMCELIMSYAGAHNSAIQFKALSEEPQRYSPHGANYDIKSLIQKTLRYLDNYDKWSYEECCRYWQKEVGGEQRKCPAWLIYAWGEKGKNVAWVKQDFKMPVKRQYDQNHITWWFAEEHHQAKGKGVGSTWAAMRGANDRGIKNVGVRRGGAGDVVYKRHDHVCQLAVETNVTERLARLQAKMKAGLNEPSVMLGNNEFTISKTEQSSLSEQKVASQVSITLPPKQSTQPTIQQTRLSQITKYSTVFQPEPPTAALSYPKQVEQMSKSVQDKINPEELKALFKWVTEGHLLEVEKLLKKNPTLTLGTGTVKDLSDRTFTNITVLQYAAWALDSEMCESIMPYAEAHNSAIQFKALSEEPTCYSSHGVSYDMTPLITKTKTYDNNYANWNAGQCRQYWQKEVGGEQRKCPAWLIYAWSEEGADVAWTKKDAARKVNREYDKHRLVWWFTENYNNGRGVGTKWGVIRGERARSRVRGVGGLWDDSKASDVYDIPHDAESVSLLGKSRGETLQRLRANVDSQLNQPSMGFCKEQLTTTNPAATGYASPISQPTSTLSNTLTATTSMTTTTTTTNVISHSLTPY